MNSRACSLYVLLARSSWSILAKKSPSNPISAANRVLALEWPNGSIYQAIVGVTPSVFNKNICPIIILSMIASKVGHASSCCDQPPPTNSSYPFFTSSLTLSLVSRSYSPHHMLKNLMFAHTNFLDLSFDKEAMMLSSSLLTFPFRSGSSPPPL